MLSGWFVDIVIEYLLRNLTRAVRRRGSSAWPRATATVTSSVFKKGYACYVAEVVYTYRVAGELYLGTEKKPFLSRDAGNAYAEHIIAGAEFTVRVKPGDPSISVVP